MNDKWIALNTECSFVSDLLGVGATLIGRANYSRRGLYFQAFTNLSVGLERAGKISFIVDYALGNAGSYPNGPELKKIGHNLITLYELSQEIAKRHGITFKFHKSLDTDLHQNILSCLNNFALGDRYHNIDLMVDTTNKENPIHLWRQSVDNLIWERHVTAAKKRRIQGNAAVMGALFSDVAQVRHIKDDGAQLRTMESASAETGFFKAVVPMRRLLVLQIIRYWSEIFFALTFKALESKLNIPFLSEYLTEYYNDDRYLKSRKQWDNIRPWQ